MTKPAGSNLSIMFSQSIEVLKKPSIATFERFERGGTVMDAGIYVAVTAAIAGIFGLIGGVNGFIAGILGTLAGFFAFSYIVYYLGKQRGGTGTFDEVAYTFSLFWVPIWLAVAVLTFLLVITIIGIIFLPLLLLAAVAASVYFAYLATQSSMNLTPASGLWTILILAGIGSWLASVVVNAIFRA